MKGYALFTILFLVCCALASVAVGCTNGIIPDGGDSCPGEPIGESCTGFCGVEGTLDCVGGAARCRIDHAPVERCNDGVDNNCNGSTDEGCSASCTPTAEVCGNTRDDDCDDLVDEDCDTCVPQSAEETVCDNIDDDCDGRVDEGCDDDNDDYCDSGMTVASGGCSACPHTPSGGSGDDCNDENASINPGADEICDDGIDNNCDGDVDEGCGPTCTPTNGGVEICDDLDNDCNGWVDDGGVCDVCEENLGGTLTIRPTASRRASCSQGLVLVAWGPGGSEHRSAEGATTFTISMSSSWRGWVRLQAFCPDPGVDGTVVGEWRGTATNWSGLSGRSLREAGFVVDIDGRDVSDASLVCVDPGVGHKPHVTLDECSAFTCPS